MTDDQPRPRQEGMTVEQKMATAPIVEDGQWYEPTENPFIHGCCECGLSHRVEYLIEKGALSLRFFRDADATAALMQRLERDVVPTDAEADSKEWWRQVAQGLAIKCREAETRALVSQPSSPATPETTEETDYNLSVLRVVASDLRDKAAYPEASKKQARIVDWAAERIAQLTQERDEARDACLEWDKLNRKNRERAEAAEAKVQALEAQVEQLRQALDACEQARLQEGWRPVVEDQPKERT